MEQVIIIKNIDNYNLNTSYNNQNTNCYNPTSTYITHTLDQLTYQNDNIIGIMHMCNNCTSFKSEKVNIFNGHNGNNKLY